MWKIKARVIPVIIGATGTISKSFRKYINNVKKTMKWRNNRKQPYWALHTYCGKCKRKSTIVPKQELAI
jgi:hypothetical protein